MSTLKLSKKMVTVDSDPSVVHGHTSSIIDAPNPDPIVTIRQLTAAHREVSENDLIRTDDRKYIRLDDIDTLFSPSALSGPDKYHVTPDGIHEMASSAKITLVLKDVRLDRLLNIQSLVRLIGESAVQNGDAGHSSVSFEGGGESPILESILDCESCKIELCTHHASLEKADAPVGGSTGLPDRMIAETPQKSAVAIHGLGHKRTSSQSAVAREIRRGIHKQFGDLVITSVQVVSPENTMNDYKFFGLTALEDNFMSLVDAVAWHDHLTAVGFTVRLDVFMYTRANTVGVHKLSQIVAVDMDANGYALTY